MDDKPLKLRWNEWLAILLAVSLISLAAIVCNGATPSPDRVLASVRIGQRGGCSGTIIAIGKRKAYGLSAAHCCSGVGNSFLYGNPDGTTGEARWIAVDRPNDLALFVCWSEYVLASVCVPYDALPDWTKPLYGIGYPSRKGPIFKRLRFTNTHDVQEGRWNGRYRNGRKVMVPTGKTLPSRYCLKNIGGGNSGNGDSGGGVFYDGCLVGVMTHGNRRYPGHHAASLPQIVAFLAKHQRKFDGTGPFT